MRRPDINNFLNTKLQKYAWIMDPRAFKFQVRKFMQDSKHQRIKDLKNQMSCFRTNEDGIYTFNNIDERFGI